MGTQPTSTPLDALQAIAERMAVASPAGPEIPAMDISRSHTDSMAELAPQLASSSIHDLLSDTPSPTRTPSTPRPTLQGLLGQELTLLLRDGRTFIGYLLCIDKGVNIILRDAEEFRPDYPVEDEQPAKLSQEELDRWTEIRRNRQMYWPRSEPFGGEGTGWGGRGMGMVGVKGSDVVKIEVAKDVWRGMGGLPDEHN
ncbi:hypothetical protein IAU60_005781 [Kwoniella sp. DSM 27419]